MEHVTSLKKHKNDLEEKIKEDVCELRKSEDALDKFLCMQEKKFFKKLIIELIFWDTRYFETFENGKKIFKNKELKKLVDEYRLSGMKISAI